MFHLFRTREPVLIVETADWLPELKYHFVEGHGGIVTEWLVPIPELVIDEPQRSLKGTFENRRAFLYYEMDSENEKYGGDAIQEKQ